MAKTALITGASRGIGAACARLLARDGFDICINFAGNENAAANVAQEVENYGQSALLAQGDVSDEDQVEAMFDRCIRHFGPIDVAILNAGIIHKAMPLADMPIDEIRRIIDIDLTAQLICAREAVRRMARSRGGQGGVIVLMSSKAATLNGAGGFQPYGCAKAGMDSLIVGLGREVADDGLRVVGLRPGLIDTDIQDDTGIANRIARFGPQVPMGRGGTADEVAEAVAWLVSDKASYVTATVFDVSGGR